MSARGLGCFAFEAAKRRQDATSWPRTQAALDQLEVLPRVTRFLDGFVRRSRQDDMALRAHITKQLGVRLAGLAYLVYRAIEDRAGFEGADLGWLNLTSHDRRELELEIGCDASTLRRYLRVLAGREGPAGGRRVRLIEMDGDSITCLAYPGRGGEISPPTGDSRPERGSKPAAERGGEISPVMRGDLPGGAGRSPRWAGRSPRHHRESKKKNYQEPKNVRSGSMMCPEGKTTCPPPNAPRSSCSSVLRALEHGPFQAIDHLALVRALHHEPRCPGHFTGKDWPDMLRKFDRAKCRHDPPEPADVIAYLRGCTLVSGSKPGTTDDYLRRIEAAFDALLERAADFRRRPSRESVA